MNWLLSTYESATLPSSTTTLPSASQITPTSSSQSPPLSHGYFLHFTRSSLPDIISGMSSLGYFIEHADYFNFHPNNRYTFTYHHPVSKYHGTIHTSPSTVSAQTLATELSSSCSSTSSSSSSGVPSLIPPPAGSACVPSPSSPICNSNVLYFNGGYNTHIHGASWVGRKTRIEERKKERLERDERRKNKPRPENVSSRTVSTDVETPLSSPCTLYSTFLTLEHSHFVSAQLESAYVGSRDTSDHMTRFAHRLCKAVVLFSLKHLTPGLFDQLLKRDSPQ